MRPLHPTDLFFYRPPRADRPFPCWMADIQEPIQLRVGRKTNHCSHMWMNCYRTAGPFGCQAEGTCHQMHVLDGCAEGEHILPFGELATRLHAQGNPDRRLPNALTLCTRTVTTNRCIGVQLLECHREGVRKEGSCGSLVHHKTPWFGFAMTRRPVRSLEEQCYLRTFNVLIAHVFERKAPALADGVQQNLAGVCLLHVSLVRSMTCIMAHLRVLVLQ